MNPNFSHFKDKNTYLSIASKLCEYYFGFKTLRAHQMDCINSTWNHTCTFLLSPTGSGKSMCYVLPALMSQGISIIISPLISLMDDQVKKLKDRSILAECLHSSMSRERKKEVLAKLKIGKIKILFVSVERFCTPGFIRFILEHNQVSLIAIDEAHCISDWKFFRPSYMKLNSTLKSFDNPTLIFLTATATKSKLRSIFNITGTDSIHLVVVNSIRKNLNIKTFFSNSYEDKILLLIKYLKEQAGSGIIYTTTREETENLSLILSRMNIKCKKYHGGLISTEKEESLKYFLQEPGSLLIATKAFGMGIDKPDIRFVFHSSMPSCMEDYFQEIGRAGRDGLSSNTYMFYSPEDVTVHRFMLDLSFPEPYIIKSIYKLTTLYLRQGVLNKTQLLSKLKEDIKVRSCFGIENVLDILLRFKLISFKDRMLLTVSSSCQYSIKEVTKIIHQEKKEQLKKLSTLIRYINTTNESLKDKLYFNYFNVTV